MYFLKLNSTAGGIDAHGEVDLLLINGKGEVLLLVLFGIPGLDRLFGEHCLEGGAFEGVIPMPDH